jgi:hypothetical protein
VERSAARLNPYAAVGDPKSPCPSPEMIGQFANAGLSGPGYAAMEAPVETCSACQDILKSKRSDLFSSSSKPLRGRKNFGPFPGALSRAWRLVTGKAAMNLSSAASEDWAGLLLSQLRARIIQIAPIAQRTCMAG